MTREIREVIGAPCCKFYNTDITHSNVKVLQRVVKVARARHGWRCNVVRDELNKPTWRLYIATRGLERSQLREVKQKQGPVKVLKSIVAELSK